MTELTITRGRDVALYLDEEMLFGVMKLHAQSRYQRHEIREYLTDKSHACVPAGESHIISLTVLSLFREAIPAQGSFVLRVIDDGTEYRYENCCVTEHERSIAEDQPVTDTYTIRSDQMTKRRITHDG